MKRGVELVLWKWMRTFQTRGNEYKAKRQERSCVFQEYLGKKQRVCEVGESLENLRVFSQIVNTLECHYS